MPAAVVLYDPDRSLPSSFTSDEGFDDDVVLVDDVADAHRRSRLAKVLVIVGARDEAGAIGLLASSDETSAPALVLYMADPRLQRRVVIHAVRHGATVLIGQPPGALAACLRDLVAPRLLGRDAEHICRAAASALSARALSLLLVAAHRARAGAGARDLALALGVSTRTLSRRVRVTELRSISELLAWGRLLRTLALTESGATQRRQAQLGGFTNARALDQARHRLLASGQREQRELSVSSITSALTARCHEADRPASPSTMNGSVTLIRHAESPTGGRHVGKNRREV